MPIGPKRGECMSDRAASLLLLANAAQFDSSACISALPMPPSTSLIISSAFRLWTRGDAMLDDDAEDEAGAVVASENDG